MQPSYTSPKGRQVRIMTNRDQVRDPEIEREHAHQQLRTIQVYQVHSGPEARNWELDRA